MNQSKTPIGQLVAVSIMVIAVTCAGCRKKAEDKPTVALIVKSLANEFFKTMEEGARAHHAQHQDEYDLKVVGIKNETDVSQQIECVELMMAQGVDAIVIAPADSKALVAVCKRAQDAGIIVVNIDDTQLGLVVDTVREVITIEDGDIAPPPALSTASAGHFIKGMGKVGDDVKVLLDAQKLLVQEELVALA